jgi:predicted ribosomally synthesized peptide with SipW-like signal peptide
LKKTEREVNFEMRRIKKAKRKNGIALMMIACIVAMGVMGGGYAYWNDSLSIEAKVETGSFDPCFGDINNDGYINYSENDHEIEISIIGEDAMEKGEKERALEIKISQGGTVPFELKKSRLNGLNGSNPADILVIDESYHENYIEFIIIPRKAGEYEFEYERLYGQPLLGNNDGWQKTLTISGMIEVVEPEEVVEMGELSLVDMIDTDDAATPTEEPVAEDPVAEDPVAEDPVAEDPVAEDPVAEDPVAEDPVAEDPVDEEPAAAGPVEEPPI